MASERQAENVETVRPGSFVLLDYVIRVKDVDELVDTTIEEEAKKAGWSDATRIYEARLTVVGRGYLLKSIEDEIVGMQEGSYKKFEIPPEKAFGLRDPNKVKVYPLKRFRDYDQPLTVGSRIVIDGREGVIRSIGSGRVQVDFNHHLADKTLVCEVWVREILRDRLSKVYHLLHSKIPEIDLEKTSIVEDGNTIRITLQKDVYLLSGLQMVKRMVAKEIFDYIEGIEKVVFVEEYSREDLSSG